MNWFLPWTSRGRLVFFFATFLFIFPVQNYIPLRDFHVGVGCIGGLSGSFFTCYYMKSGSKVFWGW